KSVFAFKLFKTLNDIWLIKVHCWNFNLSKSLMILNLFKPFLIFVSVAFINPRFYFMWPRYIPD
ncbi:hypothetical protein YC68_24660, partial [Vibrio parahaemolyticus]